MDILPLLDELQAIARNGLTYAVDPSDRARYQRLFDLACAYYSQSLDLLAPEVQQRLSGETGYITAKAAVAAALFDDAGRILLVPRADGERWGLPGGWMAPNESPAEAAVRAARVEIGLDIRALQLVDVYARAPSGDDNLHTLVETVYLCERDGGAPRVAHESLDLRSWRIDDVPAWHAQHRSYALAAHAAWLARHTW